MDLPYHNSYHYNHEWSMPSTSENFSLYPTTNCYNTSSCHAPPPPPPSAVPSTTYYDYYTSSNCCPSTINTCSNQYNTYSSFNQHNINPINCPSQSNSNSISTSTEYEILN